MSGFLPLKSEINPLPLMRKLADAGARLALPVVAGRGKPLIMRAWTLGRAAQRRRLGHPRAETGGAGGRSRHPARAAAAFDRRGHRIGYGAGYYDLTIARLRSIKPVIAVGIAYAVQEIADVPATARDERLDLVLTEREVIDLRKA